MSAAPPETVATPEKGPLAAARLRFGPLLVLLFLGLTFLLGCFRMWNGDIWWHLRTGQLILERRAVPATDWFTYTGPDRVWVDLHWGFQVVMATAYALGGTPLLVLLKACLGTLAVGLTLLARRPNWPWEISILAWLPALLVLSGRFYVRPEIFTLVFLAAFLVVMFRVKHRPGLLALLPVVQVLWVNSQGLFILGPIVLACYWLGCAAEAALVRSRDCRPLDGTDPQPADRLRFTHLAAATVAVALACLVNPYFLEGALFPLELSRKLSVDKAFYGTHIMELQSAGDFLRQHGPSNPYLVLHLVTLALGSVSFLVLGAGRRLSVYRLSLFAVFGYLGWQATRNNNHFALVAGYVTVCNFCEAWEMLRSRRVAVPGRPSLAVLSRSNRGVVAGRLVLAGVFILMGWLVASNRFYDRAGEGRRFGLGERTDWYIHDAARFLGREGMPRRVFVANLGQAGVALFHNGPEQRVFIDARLEVNSRETFQRYLGILRRMAAGDPGWTTLAGAPGETASEPPAVLLDRLTSTPALRGMLAMPGWRLVYADRVSVVFLQTKTADRLGLPRVSLRQLLDASS